MSLFRKKPTVYNVQVKAFGRRRLVTIARFANLDNARALVKELEGLGFQCTIHWKEPKR